MTKFVAAVRVRGPSMLVASVLWPAVAFAQYQGEPTLANAARSSGRGAPVATPTRGGATSSSLAAPAITPAASLPPGLMPIPSAAAAEAGVSAASAPLAPRLMLRLGSLERSAQAMATAMAAYREALAELVPAAHAAVAAGGQPGAKGSWPVPAPARASFVTWAQRLAALPRTAGMPPLGWAYHSSLVDTLTELGEVRRLDGLLAPSQALAAALGHQANLAADVLATLGAQRALGVYNVDDAAVAREARDRQAELQRALRTPATTPAAQAALDHALHDALDAAAFAEASNASTPERLGSSYLPLLQASRSVGDHLVDLGRVMAAMAAPPAPAAGDLRASVTEGAGEALTVHLQWTPPSRQGAQPASVRVVRRVDVAQARDVLGDATACGATDQEHGAQLLAELLAHEAPETVAELPGEAFAYNEDLPAPRRDWPQHYRVVAVSAFGVEAHAHEVLALPTFATLQPPHHVQASALTPRYDDRQFYRLADAVQVRWRLSASDLGERDVPGAARVRGYDIYRLDSAAAQRAASNEPALAPLVAQPTADAAPLAERAPPGWLRVGAVEAQVDTFVDRPPMEVLADGVAYVVVALTADGTEALAQASCGQSSLLRADVGDAWRLARAGAARLPRPTAAERAASARLGEPAALAAAQATFAARPPVAQQALWQQYWNRLPEPQRDVLLRSWRQQLSDAEAAQALAEAPPQLPAALRPWAQLLSYVAQAPQLRVQAQQHWQLLSPTEQADANHAYRHTFGPAFAGEGNPELALWAWWRARDEEEQAALHRWWQGASEDVQAARLASFWQALTPAQRAAAAWPEPALLDPEERARWLTQAPWPVPQRLAADFLAFVAYDELPLAAKEAAIAAEAGLWRRGLEALHYAVRPLDVWLDFKLPLVTVLMAMGLLAGWLLQYAARDGDGEDEGN